MIDINANRKLYKDLLRIISAFGVIIGHCAGPVVYDFTTASGRWITADIYASLIRFSVPVFFMISGSIFLDPKLQKYDKMPKKNLSRLGIAFAFWSVVYLLFRMFYLKREYADIYTILGALFEGNHHLYFLWFLSIIYLAVPLLRKITSDKKKTEYFLLFSFIFFIFLRFIVNLPFFDFLSDTFSNISLSMSIGFAFHFVAGYYFDSAELKARTRKLIYACGFLCAAIIAFGTYYFSKEGGEYKDWFLNNISPFCAVLGIAVFVFVRECFKDKDFSEKSYKTIVFISSLTFGIYLSHELFTKIAEQTGIFDALPTVVSIPAEAAAVFVVSAVLTFVLSKIPLIGKYIV